MACINIDIQNQQAKIKQIKDTMSYDDEIVKLRTNIKTSSEIKMRSFYCVVINFGIFWLNKPVIYICAC